MYVLLAKLVSIGKREKLPNAPYSGVKG